MEDLLERLAHLRDDGPAAPQPVVSADLARGRRALRRRRTRVLGAGVALGVAVAGTSVFLAAGGPARRSPGSAPGGDVQPRPATRLVSYSGPQARGFRITEIPAGYGLRVEASQPEVLDIAKAGDTSPANDFVGKLVITAEEGAAPKPGVDGKPVTIDGGPGTIARDSSGITMVRFVQHGLVITVQCWNNIGLSEDQLIEFSDGVSVTKDVRTVHG